MSKKKLTERQAFVQAAEPMYWYLSDAAIAKKWRGIEGELFRAGIRHGKTSKRGK